MSTRPTYYEFFAGGGMARAGLGEGWDCLFANDFSPQKAASYRENWGNEHLHVGDVWALTPRDLPGRADLAWASSPCQDLSLAGKRGGLSGARSSAFWGFEALMRGLDNEGRAPRLLVIENVVGLLTSNGGADFSALCEALAGLGYTFGALEIDAATFLPHSRPRLFVVAAKGVSGRGFTGRRPHGPFHSRRVVGAYERLSMALRACWRWWLLPEPPVRNTTLEALLDPDGSVIWFDENRTKALVDGLSPAHRQRLDSAGKGGKLIAPAFRRMRIVQGRKTQRTELRLDGVAGCIRTPRGGSSRQFLIKLEEGKIQARLLSSRECARLMGLGDDFAIPDRETEGLQLIGDGLAVPVVRFLATNLLSPLLLATPTEAAA